MVRRRNVKVNRRAGEVRALKRGRGVGLGAAVGAFLAFGMTPLAIPPSARADVVDDVIDQVLAPFMDAATNTVDWDALLTPTAWDAFLAPVHWDAVFADLSAQGAGAGSGGADPAMLVPAPAVSDSSTPDLTALFEQFVYTPLHTGVQDWIHSDLGLQVDGFVNHAAGQFLIGDGAAGTAADPNGGAGGLWFGDGGAGYDSTQAGVAGGDGGAAGFFGNGGDGGNGGAGANGGNGGDGGSAPGLFGNGGDGGNGGNSGVGGNPTGLPALGGAGGTGGLLGSHGAVGHYGTLVGEAQTATSDIGTTGTWLTNSDGQVVVLHGLYEVDKLPPYEPSATGFGDDDAAFLADNGFNVVQLGVIWAAVEPEPG
ncbi:MAG: PGRS repeat-containing protein, partial [Mycobacterium sp.]